MLNKMKLLPPRFLKHKNPPQEHQATVSSSARHSWVPCREQPKTLSFRATHENDTNSTNEFISTLSIQDSGDEEEEEELENVIRGVRKSSARLFFSPEKTNSILKNTSTDHNLISTTQVEKNAPMTIAMESLDPYMDFMTSMEEMVEAHGLCEWDLLEELLGCYLMLNEKRNHTYIIRAFADLVLKSHFPHLTSNSSVCCSPSLVSDSFITSFSSRMQLSSTSTTGETSCSSSIAPVEAARGDCIVDSPSSLS